MSIKCPECGADFDHAPFKKCRTHLAYDLEEEQRASRQEEMRRAALPWDRQVEEATSLEQLKDVLARFMRAHNLES